MMMKRRNILRTISGNNQFSGSRSAHKFKSTSTSIKNYLLHSGQTHTDIFWSRSHHEYKSKSWDIWYACSCTI